MGIQNYSVKEALNVKLGQGGSTLITDTSAHTGTYVAITFLEATTFTALTDANRDGNTIGSQTFPVGATIYGTFTSITLASGACIAYKG